MENTKLKDLDINDKFIFDDDSLNLDDIEDNLIYKLLSAKNNSIYAYCLKPSGLKDRYDKNSNVIKL